MTATPNAVTGDETTAALAFYAEKLGQAGDFVDAQDRRIAKLAEDEERLDELLLNWPIYRALDIRTRKELDAAIADAAEPSRKVA